MRIPEKPPGIPWRYNYETILDEITKIGKSDAFFEINESRFPYWDKWKYTAKEWKMDPIMLWTAVKSNRRGNRLQINSLPAFTACSPSIVQEYLHDCDMNLGGNMQGDGIIPPEEKDRYLISSLMEEAIASSQLEGASTERKLAKEMLANNRKPKNTSEQMIVNNYEAMNWIVTNKNLPFTPERLCSLHAIITRDTLTAKSEEGVYREDNEVAVRDMQTGGILHQPPDFEALPELMQSFCDFANESKKESFFIHPVSRGIILHFLLGYIHPFSDGNGRTARTVFYWYLLKKGYWLIEYMSVSRVILNSKAQYARAYLYTETDENDLTYFLIYNLKCIAQALEKLKEYIKRKSTEKKNVLSLLRQTQFNDRQISILREIMTDPGTYFTVQKLEDWFKISNQTARNDLNGLVEAGLMDLRRSGKKLQYLPVKDAADRIENNRFK